ncbi:branched-chain amino acid transport system II carrier protein [Metabacillus bambusae]|uniref:Branched-chain amino acid transport system carrier protein n=1 Tax=Metabacillus bambusae TaxID=2795218 RepID=A0ABS3MWM5_9BACI|nr:branched-chain amino acid transport system II carrier protein [Metabacillus bambusae]MBO1510236.1 branched-chain amino acid transport system II carrier protein [Metabacillus bambusae]
MNKKMSGKETIVIGLMLFALFFGAGNMIFPPALGQQAGEHVWSAISGFLITGVGLPFLGILAIALTGSDVQTLGEKVHPKFGITFAIVLYLTIGPLFGIPRTGTVAYEIGITPFLPSSFNNSWVSLLVYTILFFGITFWLALNPSKLIDRIGKILTPALILILILLSGKALLTPMGGLEAPTGDYLEGAFFKGFLEGYLTMDTLSALVFGIVIISAVKERGIVTRKEITKVSLKAGIIAAIGLIFVYISLSYIGATSVSSLGYSENGGVILSGAASTLFGSLGNVVLGLAITFACLTTSVGLVSACGNYLSKVFPTISYQKVILIITIFSTCIANFGLSQLISFSVPLLVTIYPLAIVLILLSFIDIAFGIKSIVYIISLSATVIFSIVDGLNAANLNLSVMNDWLSYIPLFNIGMGWLVPAILGAIIGYIISNFQTEK